MSGFFVEENGILDIATFKPYQVDTTTTSIEFVHDQNYYKYRRITYTILDYLRDIGGLLGSFNGIFTGLIFIVNFNGLYHWLTS